MAREYARTNVTIWQDPDFRALPYPAQMLYYMLWTHPELSYCGVLDWRPAKLTGNAAGWTKKDLQACADCLEARHFIVTDDETEECLVRSWVRWDGLIRQPRLAVSFANAYAAVGSNLIRGVIVHELNKLRALEPGAEGWGKPQVKAMAGLPTINPKTRDTVSDPFGSGFVISLGSVSSEVSVPFGPNASGRFGSVSDAPTPSPTPAPISITPNEPASQVRATPTGDESAQTLVAEWIDHCGPRPPKNVIGQISGQINSLLTEGIPYADVRAGLIAWQTKGLHPSTLPSVVHETRTSRPGSTRRQQATNDTFDRAMAWAREADAS